MTTAALLDGAAVDWPLGSDDAMRWTPGPPLWLATLAAMDVHCPPLGETLEQRRARLRRIHQAYPKRWRRR